MSYLWGPIRRRAFPIIERWRTGSPSSGGTLRIFALSDHRFHAIAIRDTIVFSGGSAHSMLDAILGQCKAPPSRPSHAGPPPASPPEKPKCCEKALRGSLDDFLQGQAAPLFGWDAALTDDLISAGRNGAIDPRLMAAIATLESGHGSTLQFNNPFGLQPPNRKPYASALSAVSDEGANLSRYVYRWHEDTVAKLYAGNTWVFQSGMPPWPQYVEEYPAYCVGTNPATGKMDSEWIARCQAGGRTVAGFLSGMAGDTANDPRPGDPNNLTYPCPK